MARRRRSLGDRNVGPGIGEARRVMDSRESAFVLGQRYNLATLALAVALLSFLNLAGLEKAILAIVLGMKALRLAPEPALEQRRGWARLGIVLGATHVVLVVTVVLLNLDRIAQLLDALRAVADLR
jgi:hypothetical protein